MTFVEAMKALERGEKIRIPHWDCDAYIRLNYNSFIVDEAFRTYALPARAFKQQWELYTEPKPKKEVWQWRYKVKESGYWYSADLLLTEEEASKRWKTLKYEKHAGPFEVDE